MSQQIYQFGASRAETAGYQLLTNPGTIYRIDGFCTGSNTFLQLFDKASAPSANAVPLKSLQLFGGDGFSYTFLKEDMVSFVNGLYIAISTSEVNYVADTSGTKVSGDITIEDLSIVIGATKAGLTDVFGTGVLDVWDATIGPKKLTQINFTNGAADGTKRWLAICAMTASDALIGNVLFFYPLFTTSNGDGTGTVTNRTSGVLSFAGEFDNKGLDVFGITPSTSAPPRVPAIGCAIFLISNNNPAGVSVDTLSVVTTEHTTLTAYYQ